MPFRIRPYGEEDLAGMLRAWNGVVEAGNAFPQIDVLTEDHAWEFFASQSHCGVAVRVASDADGVPAAGAVAAPATPEGGTDALAGSPAAGAPSSEGEAAFDRAPACSPGVPSACSSDVPSACSPDGPPVSSSSMPARSPASAACLPSAPSACSSAASGCSPGVPARSSGVSSASAVLGMYILHPNNVGRCGHVANASYAVVPEARGCGIGRALVRDSLARAAALGFRGLQFNAVVASNKGAIRLYESLGFVHVGTVPGGFLNGRGVYEDIHVFYRDTE